MSNTSKIIRELRKKKGITQEELATQANVNLRTIQRIENNQSLPRESTLLLICEVLEIDIRQLKEKTSIKESTILSKMVEFTFIILINLISMFVVGYMTLDSNANINSAVAGLLLSILIPLIIVFYTQQLDSNIRVLKYGSGYIIYALLVMIVSNIKIGFITGLFPCLIISLLVLKYGNILIPSKES